MATATATTGTVLVTGGAGYIGSHAVLALVDAGRPVAVIDTLATGFRWAVPEGVPFYQGDVADPDLIDRIASEQGISAIMHFAGSLLVPESVVKPLDYYRNNVVASRSLIESAVRNGIKHFIFSSTAAVYGVPEVVPVDEMTPKSPINPYGNSKLMTEIMLADVARAHPINYGALRYFNVAGADPAARSGQSTRGATHLIHVAAEAARGLRSEVMVYGTDYDTPDGTGVRDYIHVSDLAAAHVAALGALEAAPTESFALNCGYSRGFSVLEVLDAVDRVTNLKLKRTIAPRRAGDPDTLVAATARIHERLDWTPKYDRLETIVSHALEWERQLDLRGLRP
ncbi:UDP-glucose 4-epimerase GalE [Polymorphobacter megasporae]|uniref:UDP-glucose 4-epimerase GalE n=1 Tax=Glacieibacterium megasporae TaxID=2835787 RepID=UPI001C1E6F02|nr:UDP-glucose 4-epimerase GalE [Polymorphobacter megasporae]UAJ11252.1 UDP-glucose 4-epimerase GalE [Polymorphobacter megasporae]